MVAEELENHDLADWMPALLAADPTQGYLAISILVTAVPIEAACAIWKLAADELESTASLPFLRAALDAAERALVDEEAEEARGWQFAEASAALAGASPDATEAREVLARAREVLGLCRMNGPEFALLVQLLALAQSQEEHDLTSQLADEVLQAIAGSTEVVPELEELLLRAAYVAYYERHDWPLVLRCVAPLAPTPTSLTMRGLALQREGRAEEALEVWDQIGDEDDPALALNRAAMLISMGELGEAAPVLDRLVKRHPAYWKGWVQRGLLRIRGSEERGVNDLEHAFELAVNGEADASRLADAAMMAHEAAIENDCSNQMAQALLVLVADSREVVQIAGHYCRGVLLSDAERYPEAASTLQAALDLLTEDVSAGVPIREALVKALLATGADQKALEVMKPLVEMPGLPEGALELLDSFVDEDLQFEVRLLRAVGHRSEMRLALAERELSELLDEEPGVARVHRLRGLTRLSTAARSDEDAWNEAASYERYLTAIEDIGAAAALGDDLALGAFRWAVDRARGDWRMKELLQVVGDEEFGMYRLMPGLKAADEALGQARELAALSRREWAEAAVATEAVQTQFQAVGLPAEAGRQDLFLADLALRLGDPRRALDHLDRCDSLLPLEAEPLPGEERSAAREILGTSAARGAAGMALPLEYLVFLGGTMRGSMAYLKMLRAQTLAALGRAGAALSELGDEKELIAEREKLGLLSLDGGESVRAIMAILRDSGHHERALELRDIALEAADSPLRQAAILITSAGCWLNSAKPERALADLNRARTLTRDIENDQFNAIVDHTEANVVQESDPERVLELLNAESVSALSQPARVSAALVTRAHALAHLGSAAAADRDAIRAEELLVGHMQSIDLPSDRSMSLQAWGAARSLRCTLACRAGESENALQLLAGLKGRALGMQRTLAISGPQPSSAVEVAVSEERDDLLALLRHAELHAGAVSWIHLRRVQAHNEKLVDTSGGAKLDLDEASAALEDAQRRLSRLQVRRSELPREAQLEKAADIDALRQSLGGAEGQGLLVEMFLGEGTCYLTGLRAAEEPWTVGVPCDASELVELAESSRVGADWSDGDPVWSNDSLRRIVDALQQRSSEGDHLAIVRHGPLHALPMHAVEGEKGALIERHTVSYAPSSDALLSCTSEETAQGGAGIVVADSLGDLPHARLEGQAVAELLGTVALTGLRADRRRLLSLIGEQGPAVVHIACHGVFDDVDPDASRLILAGSSTHDAPMAAADLTARDVAQLPLRGSVVVLSACHSGVNAMLPGDEPFGLTRAFLAAGARAVVGARWAVSDISTWLLMERFTSLWRSDRLPIAESLARAQRWIRQMPVEEMVDLCNAALERRVGDRADVEVLLARRRAEGLIALRREDPARSSARQADLLALMSNPSLREAHGLTGTDPFPFSDRRHWAAFELVGDWTSEYPEE